MSVSHSGFKGNAIDKLAKLAAKEKYIDPEPWWQ